MLVGGRYELKDALGQGGMGIVYRAFDCSTRRDVALKTMHDAANPLAVELFSKEWSVLASISHPNIVDILDCGEFETKGQRRPYFVMPLLPGKTLEHLIHSSSQRLTVTRIVEILRQTCRGLQAAHERDLVHRDLKPSNIFVMEDDTAKIIDFGVVHLVGSQSITGLKGTVQYMAPEQLEFQGATPQSDIFSLGVVAYEALTGRKPFARNNEVETAEAVRMHIPPPACEINPAAGDQISRVIHKAMAKQPWNRFANARDFGLTLEKALRGEIAIDTSKIKPRIGRASKALNEGDLQFACDILNELEAEGNIDPEMAVLRLQIDQASQQRAVRQLLESARTRIEQEEFPLALQKVQEVLRLDSGNAEALGMRRLIESQRSERQIENWLRMAREHLNRGSFSEARQGLEEALKLNPNDSRITQLLSDLSRQEQENSRARAQKEQFYDAARQAFQNGEISTALSKLERVLELNRRMPDKTAPERDALYQNFYNQVRSESEANRIAYQDAHRHLLEKEFARAREICEENLKKYPGQAIFQALRLEIDERERQELYSYAAEIERRMDAEPDLDRKLNIAKEAAERYPNEAQFRQSLKLVRDRRDLVIGIVAKSRQYEERGQFSEAIGQWEILRGIYPQYPGLTFELEQLKRRRDQQSHEEEKNHWVEQTDAALTAGDFEHARKLANEALLEFRDDAELVGLKQLAEQGLERRHQSQLLLEQGRTLCASGQFEAGIAALREAVELDRHNVAPRSVLVEALVKRAQELLATDWQAAEPVIESAIELEGGNAAAKSIRAQLQDYRRRQIVDRCLAEARELRAANNYPGALSRIDEALQSYPNEPRLMQFRASLAKDDAEVRSRKQRSEDLLKLRELSAQSARIEETAALESVRQQSATLAQKYPDDGEFTSVMRAIEQRATIAIAPASPLNLDQVAPQNGGPHTASPNLPPPSQAAAPAPDSLPASRPPKRSGWLIGSAVVGALLLIVAAWLVTRTQKNPGRSTAPVAAVAQSYPVRFDVTPAGATVQVDGKPATSSQLDLAAGSHTLAVAMPGYQSVSRTFSAESGTQIAIALEPELQHLQISLGSSSAKVLLDNVDLGSLQQGQFSKDDISLAEHTIKIIDAGREIANVHLSAKAAEAPELASPLAGNLLVLASFAGRGTLYAGGRMQAGDGKGGALQLIPAEGLAVSSGNAVLVSDGHHEQSLSVPVTNFPLMSLYANVDTDTRPLLFIASNVEDAQLSINSQPVNWRSFKGKIRGRLEPGTYNVKLSKPGYEDSETTVLLATGDKKLVTLELKGVPVLSSLVIQGGTPGSQILIDNVSKGTLDNTGRFTIEQLTPGSYEITLRKENFESKKLNKVLAPGRPLILSSSDARLIPFGILDVRMPTPGAEIALERPGEFDFRSLKNNTAISLPDGTYTVRVSADGYLPKEDAVTIIAGNTHVLSWPLQPKPVHTTEPVGGLKLMQDPAKWQAENGWLVFGGAGYGWIQPAQGRYFVDLRKKAGRFFGAGAGIDFVAGYKEQGKYRVSYHIGRDGSLTRKVTNDSDTAEAKSPTHLSGEDAYRFQISIEPHRITVRDAKGALLDECSVTAWDLTTGQFGFKSGTALSIVR